MSDVIPRTVAVGGVYRHYKGPIYVVLFIGKDSNNDRNDEPSVVYMSMDDPRRGAVNICHVDQFVSQVTVDGKTVNRFEFLYLARRV